ncbi:hypothetical protein AT6N2_C1837 [Agrobacterium tumefaciens]|nr:hypothetical protein AT6N2_C1837 [Agrobacterium tumefaciens]
MTPSKSVSTRAGLVSAPQLKAASRAWCVGGGAASCRYERICIMRTAERRMELELVTARPGDVWRRAAVLGVSGVKTVAKRIYNRIVANGLTDLDDRLLADIGLVRSDVSDALNTGLLEDPTTHLTRAARDRAVTRFKTL